MATRQEDTAPSGYKTERAKARELNKSLRTLRLWRQRGEGPPWTKVGNLVFYRDDSSAAWLKSLEVTPVREPAVLA